MLMKEITYIIKTDGEIQIEVNGIKGKQCKKLTEKIIENLGQTISVKEKPEYYEQNYKSHEVKQEW
jgi:hypothetical protein